MVDAASNVGLECIKKKTKLHSLLVKQIEDFYSVSQRHSAMLQLMCRQTDGATRMTFVKLKQL